MRLPRKVEVTTAVVAGAPGRLNIGEIGISALSEKDILIRTLVSGISTGTDRWVTTGRFEWEGFSFPLVPGYQRMGIVEALGEAVTSVSVGDRVFATSSRNFVDAIAGWGAHAAWAVSPEYETFPAHGISDWSGSLVVSLQVGVNAASRLRSPVEERVLVVGDGIIGTSSALAAHLRGARVLLAGHHDARLAAVADLQPEIGTINTHHGWDALLAEWMPTAVIDTVQNESVISDYLRFLPCTWNSRGSRNPKIGCSEIVFAGHSPDGLTTWADMAELQKHEVTIHMVSGWTRQRIRYTLELLRNHRLTLDPLVVGIEASDGEIERLLDDVSRGALPTVAACIEWSDD